MNLHAKPNLHPKPNSIHWATIGYWLSWLALVASLFYLLASYASGRWNYGSFYGSDMMFIPRLYRDVFVHGLLTGWSFSANPYFFPDMLLMVPLDLITGNIYLTIPLYGIVQLGLLLTGLLLLQRHLFGPTRIMQSLIIQMFTLCLLLVATEKQPFYYFVFMNVFHFSVLWVLPFATVAMLQVLQPKGISEQRRAALLLFALTLLTSFSDTLFIIQFVLPALAASLVWITRDAQRWRRFLLVNGILLLAAFSGQWLRLLIVPVDTILHYTEILTEQGITSAFSYFVDQIFVIIRNDPLFTIIWLSSALALVSVLFIALLGRKQERENENRPLLMVTILLLLSMIISVIFTIGTGNFYDQGRFRYFLPTIYFPLWMGWPFLMAIILSHIQKPKVAPFGFWMWDNRLFGAGLAIPSMILLGYMLFTIQPSHFTSLITYRNPLVTCLVQEADLRDLHNGISNFWQANSITMLSDGRLEIVPVRSNSLQPHVWLINRSLYQKQFQFIVLAQDVPPEEQIQETMVVQKFGQPADTFTCEGSKVYVYNRPSDIQFHRWFTTHPEFMQVKQVGDEAEFYGYALPSDIGGVVIGLSQGASDDWQNNQGTLARAILKALPAGSYAFSINLYAESANTGSWQVESFNAETSHLLYSKPVESIGKNVVTGHFDLPQAADVEIRVNYAGHGTLFVDKIGIKRIEPAQAASFDLAASPAPSFAQDTTAQDTTAPGGLNLLHPSGFINSHQVDFAWQWTGQPLPKGQTFEVRLWPKGETIHYGAHNAMVSPEFIRQIGDTYILRLDLNGAYSVIEHGAGDYEWTVAVVAIDPAYQDLGIEAAPYPLSLLP